MTKVLQVITPFFTAETGDTFTLSEDGTHYVTERNEEFRKAGESGEVNSTYNSVFTISPEYAAELIKQGYLEPVQDTAKKEFVNIFDEIDNLIKKYSADLKNINTDMADQPECLKVEKTSVLTNILTVLNHLKSLRK